MKVHPPPAEVVVEVRPQGIARWLTGAFLAFWLAGWALGETFAVVMLSKGALTLGRALLLHQRVAAPFRFPLSAALPVCLVLVLWVALWTLGGVAAMHHLAQMLWGVERIRVGGGQLTVERRAWPFCRVRGIALERIRGVAERAGAVVVETTDDTEQLLRYGSRRARAEVRALLGQQLRPSGASATPPALLPLGWKIHEGGSPGELVLGRLPGGRRFAGALLGLMAGVSGVATLSALAEGRPPVWCALLGAFTLLLALGALRGCLAETTFHFRGETAERRTRFLGRVRGIILTPSMLVLDQCADSEGDIYYTLSVQGAERTLTVAQSAAGSGPLDALGELVQARTQYPFVKSWT